MAGQARCFDLGARGSQSAGVWPALLPEAWQKRHFGTFAPPLGALRAQPWLNILKIYSFGQTSERATR
jgi:hypothetical protein